VLPTPTPLVRTVRAARTCRTCKLGLLLAFAGALTSQSALAQLPPPEEPVDDAPEEQAPAPKSAPEQEPLVARPQPAKQPPAVNALPLVSKDAPPPLIWKWPKFSTADFVVTLTGSAVTLGAAIVKPRSRHELTGPIGFDNSVRKALRAGTLSNRYLFRDASDVGLSLTVSWPFVADALTTAWWYRGSRETAQEMALIDLETLAISGAVQAAPCRASRTCSSAASAPSAVIVVRASCRVTRSTAPDRFTIAASSAATPPSASPAPR
jgi:hypothetical protein